MNLPENAFKRALRGGSTPCGVWLMSGAPSTAEALGCVGFDFVVIDMEHVPLDSPQLIEMLRAVAGTPAAAITRLPWNDNVMIKRALDAGAQTLMVPFVQTAEDAQRAVAATRYPPEGVRGLAAMHRASRYTNVQGYAQTAADELCVVVQVETPTALANLESIANVPGVDSIFVGPGDLAASMGYYGNIAEEKVLAELERAAAACRHMGKACGIVGGNPALVKRFLEFGYTWVAVGSDMGFMVTRGREWLGEVRNALPRAS
ncbi:MAG: HpcH/HpaI aldolase/citrate lyase family protein [Pseudomonadota bacterium]|nr:HpcH/HpaI aldolase/citrate lyase family protein [Pseudomonadota bacterium]